MFCRDLAETAIFSSEMGFKLLPELIYPKSVVVGCGACSTAFTSPGFCLLRSKCWIFGTGPALLPSAANHLFPIAVNVRLSPWVVSDYQCHWSSVQAFVMSPGLRVCEWIKPALDEQ